MKRLVEAAFWTLVVWLAPFAAFAEEAGHAAGDGNAYLGLGIGAGVAVGLAGLGCGIGQGLTAGNTTAGIARNPGAAATMNTPFILGMVLIESIAIYGLLIGILLWQKLP